VRQYLTANDIANTVRMTRSLHGGTILLVEGDTDIRVYERFIDNNNCKLIPSFGKYNAIDALTILIRGNVKGIVSIVDADFWRLDNIKYPNNLFLTETHDLESMILCSDALEKILSEFGSDKKIKQTGKPLRDILLEIAMPIGILRWISSPGKNNLSLKFKDLFFEKFIDKNTLDINIEKLIGEVKNNSFNVILDENLIKNEIMQLLSKPYDPWQICSGHDLVEILSICLRNEFGNKKAKTVTIQVLDSVLRISYEYSYFRLTGLYSSLESWEKLNPPFKILK
jgi:hypothetical protein